MAETSCTRTIDAPRATAASAAARLAASRSSVARPVISPSDFLRDKPTSTGYPVAAKSPSARSRVRLCARVLPKPKPGSIADFAATGYPVLVGLSRKKSLGEITGRATDERLAASLAAALAAVARGAAIVRVHDVRETVDALKVWRAIERQG